MLQINNKKRGFTLIEMIMSLLLVAVGASIFSLVIYSGLNSWLLLKGQSGSLSDASSAVRRMVKEIRRTNGATISTITTFASSEYQYVDLDNNVIDYSQSGTNLLRSNSVLLSNLTIGGLQFVYLDNRGLATAVATNVRTIQINVTVQNGNNQAHLRSAASIRKR